jgi:hypothetical protein
MSTILVGKINIPIDRRGSVVQISQSFTSTGEIPKNPATLSSDIHDHRKRCVLVPVCFADRAPDTRDGDD